MGAVPGKSSIINSISHSGGIPSNSSGNTSRYSFTIRICSTVVPFNWLTWQISEADCVAPYSTFSLDGVVRFTELFPQFITAFWDLNQSIPKITSILDESVTTRLAWNSTPLMRRLAAKHIQFAFISPLGEFTNMSFFITHTGMSCFFIKVYAMKECKAPE